MEGLRGVVEGGARVGYRQVLYGEMIEGEKWLREDERGGWRDS